MASVEISQVSVTKQQEEKEIFHIRFYYIKSEDSVKAYFLDQLPEHIICVCNIQVSKGMLYKFLCLSRPSLCLPFWWKISFWLLLYMYIVCKEIHFLNYIRHSLHKIIQWALRVSIYLVLKEHVCILF